jgi:hypothetical protein
LFILFEKKKSRLNFYFLKRASAAAFIASTLDADPPARSLGLK